MIIRLVKMNFKENHINKFLLLFDEYKSQIQNADGCIDLTRIMQ